MNTDESISKAQILDALKKLEHSDRKKIAPVIGKIFNSDLCDPDKASTNTRVRDFTLEGRVYEADNYRDVLRRVLQIVFEKHPHDTSKIFTIRGRKCNYFSKNPNDLREPERIRGTDIYCEMNENAKMLEARCKKILHLYEMDHLSLDVMRYR